MWSELCCGLRKGLKEGALTVPNALNQPLIPLVGLFGDIICVFSNQRSHANGDYFRLHRKMGSSVTILWNRWWLRGVIWGRQILKVSLSHLGMGSFPLDWHSA